MGRLSNILNKVESKPIVESKATDAIKALIDTDFSKSDDEKGKAAQLLRGLFFSKDDEAVDFIKRLDKILSNMSVSEDMKSVVSYLANSIDDDENPVDSLVELGMKKDKASKLSDAWFKLNPTARQELSLDDQMLQRFYNKFK